MFWNIKLSELLKKNSRHKILGRLSQLIERGHRTMPPKYVVIVHLPISTTSFLPISSPSSARTTPRGLTF